MSLIPTLVPQVTSRPTTSPKGFEAFNRFRSQKHWDWTGAKPDVQLQLAFENRVQKTTGQKFVFTDAYVSKVLDNIMNRGDSRDKMMTTCCRPPTFASFLQPIGPCRV